ncbi:MAG: peptide deformylase [Planctomycetota bacterium]
MDIDLASLRIIHYPDPRLRKVCKPVESFDGFLPRLVERMFELMRADEGIGLAAPQVGVLIRLFVCNTTGDPKDGLVVVNPRLTDLADPDLSEEGCLSIPEVRGEFLRYANCKLSAQDVMGKAYSLAGHDLAARCWQHECDHLDGKLILDRFSEADKIANRRKLKQLEADFKNQKGARV